jgi:glutamate formiminotransferase/formiminotetrahydrofolate cyclodeaminase
VKLFECVPNFSEGRDITKIETIVAEARTVAGVTVLDVERNADHNRSVVSLVGEADPLLEAVFRMMRAAVAAIDLRGHRGEHPRMGAVDVVPFVPLGEAALEDAVALAERLGHRVWQELHVPVYFYAAAARRPERADLAHVRKGQFEGIRDSIATDPARAPDVGDPAVHPTAGVVAIGARPVLIAYNAYLSTPDVGVAKKIAHAARARDGGLAEVKALGFEIKERNQAQVSMNLTDYRKTPVHRAFDLVVREAERYGVSVVESEVVGLIPEDALYDAAERYLRLNNFSRENILERKLRRAAQVTPFHPPEPAPASASEAPRTLAQKSLAEFTGALAARTPTPGGGSASALAGALGVALGEMVLAFSRPADGGPSDLAEAQRELADVRQRFLELVDEDARAFEAVRGARKQRRANPSDPAAGRAWSDAVRRASEVPLETARLARRGHDRLLRHKTAVKPSIASDLVTALALLQAAREGALANVAINLDDLREAGLPTADLEAEMQALSSAA